MAKPKLEEIKTIYETGVVEHANRLLGKGWVLLDTAVVQDGNNNSHRDYVLGSYAKINGDIIGNLI